MVGNRTLTMIKPRVVEEGKTGEIIQLIEENGFKIVAMKKILLTRGQAAAFYEIHEGKPFFEDLIDFMTSGPIVPMILEKDNAVLNFRELIGATDPIKAEEGTIRKKYAHSVTQNAVHGSDSDENALIESNFFFSKLERF